MIEEIYSLYGEVEFPFGMIYPIEEAIEVSKRSPFVEDDWFCFGQDSYFSYWLCKKNVSTEDFAFTVWDHDAEENIDAPFLRTLEDLLEFLADEYNNCEFDTCSIVVTDCDSNGLKELMQIKKIFSSPLSIGEIKTQVSNGECTIKEDINFYEANKILSEYKFEHIKVLVNKN